MCGIVGYIGDRDAISFLLERLDDLSYRGYDSAGISVLDNGHLTIAKEPGKIEFLRDAVNETVIPGTIGIGHTRWATHGVPNKVNAHPHTDCSGEISLIQNGIVENYLTLKRELISRGHEFKSDTDTEIVVHLIEEEYAKNRDILDATRKAVEQLEGSFAIAVLAVGEERLIAARNSAPIIVGVGGGENYIASDITALLQDTNKIYVLENGDIVSVEKNKIEVERFGNNDNQSRRRLTIVDWKAEDVSKGDFENYMLKEIHEQPRVIASTLAGRLKAGGDINLRPGELSDEILRKMKSIHIVACGTAYHAACFGEYLFEKLFRIPVSVDVASEFRYREPIIGPDTLVMLISQSGETADTLA
ncbi:MAG: glutamine--fructose-6-phosphate transaminase (isomerizing), partial [bacterium]|nr:glutamine--fructose-6-phosphate transaminase (isomerizing) [bacterium]